MIVSEYARDAEGTRSEDVQGRNIFDALVDCHVRLLLARFERELDE